MRCFCFVYDPCDLSVEEREERILETARREGQRVSKFERRGPDVLEIFWNGN